MLKGICGLLGNMGPAIISGALIVAAPCAAQQLTNDTLSLSVNAQGGSYQLAVRGWPGPYSPASYANWQRDLFFRSVK